MTTKRFVLYWAPPFLWMSVIFVLSSMPGSKYRNIFFPHADIVAHTLLYFVLCALWARALEAQDRFPLIKKHFLFFAVVIGTIFGATDEYHQSFVPRRSMTIEDWLTDIAGCLLLVGLYMLTKKMMTRKAT
jgi:VanZ family protein